jgi:hypothetical protein
LDDVCSLNTRQRNNLTCHDHVNVRNITEKKLCCATQDVAQVQPNDEIITNICIERAIIAQLAIQLFNKYMELL